MAARKGTTPVTERLFKAIKIMLDAGTPQKEVAEYMNTSTTTVNRINQCEDYEEYRTVVSGIQIAMKKKAQEKKAQENAEGQPVQIVEHRQNVTIQATHYMMTEMQKTNELLTAISAKLAFIVDELCGVQNRMEG